MPCDVVHRERMREGEGKWLCSEASTTGGSKRSRLLTAAAALFATQWPKATPFADASAVAAASVAASFVALIELFLNSQVVLLSVA